VAIIMFSTLRLIGFFIKDHWKIFAIALGVLVLVVLFYKACGHKKASIDLETVDKINRADEKDRKAEVRKTIEENQTVVQTVANTTTIAETDVAERDKAIEAKVKEADAKIVEAKQQGRDVTQQELQCILVPGDCQ
jgi:cell division protein FtsN